MGGRAGVATSCGIPIASRMYVAAGIASHELAALMHVSKGIVTNAQLQGELLKWTLPAWLRSHGYSSKHMSIVFDDKRVASKGESWKASCSEMLMVLPIVLHFFQTLRPHEQAALARQIECFRRLCNVIDIIQTLKLRADVELCRTFDTAVRDHLKLMLEVYGVDVVKPKHHYALHLATQYSREQALCSPCLVLDTFTNERAHQSAKSFSECKKKLGGFEKNVLLRTTAHQHEAIVKFHGKPELIGHTKYSDKLRTYTRRGVRFRNITIASGDVVIANGRTDCIKLVECAGIDADEIPFLVCQGCDVTAVTRTHLSMAPIARDQCILFADEVALAHAWSREDDGFWRVIVGSCLLA